MHTANQLTLRPGGHDHGFPGGHQRTDFTGIRALAIKQVRLGCPADSTAFTPVGTIDQCNDCCNFIRFRASDCKFLLHGQYPINTICLAVLDLIAHCPHNIGMSTRQIRPICQMPLFAATLAVAVLCAHSASAQTERWYQIEISIFTNEFSDLSQERWLHAESADIQLPNNTVELRTVADFLMLDEWSAPDEPAAQQFTPGGLTPVGQAAPGEAQELDEPMALRPARLQLPDIDRDAFLLLPGSSSSFSDTNRTLDQSAAHRLLYNAVWRQPVQSAANATPIRIRAGRETDNGHELDGSITIRFNPSGDRVVLDSDLWFRQPDDSTRLLSLKQSRDMRSNEFHYLDHPAVGIVVMVFSYDRPPAPGDGQTPGLLPL